MSAETNKNRQREFVERVQSRGEIEATTDFIAADATDHMAPPGLPRGAEGAKQIFAMLRAAFPDHDAVVLDMIAEGDKVATYKIFTGTHKGDFMGVPPTGRRVSLRIMDIVRYEDGKQVEHWNVVDQLDLMRQLGVWPIVSG